MSLEISKQEYREALHILSKGITYPNVKRTRKIFPHLDDEEIEQILSLKDFTEIALPPLRVSGAYQSAGFQITKKEIKTPRTSKTLAIPTLELFPAWGRTAASYANGQFKGGGSNNGTLFLKRAVQYAEQHWKAELTQDYWIDTVTIRLRKPRPIRYQTNVFEAHFATTRSIDDIRKDQTRPLSELLDEAIVEKTIDQFVGYELEGPRSSTSQYKSYGLTNCAFDGHGINKECPVCKVEVVKDVSEWAVPLPSKISTFLMQQGFQFKKDPVYARVEEAREFHKRNHG